MIQVVCIDIDTDITVNNCLVIINLGMACMITVYVSNMVRIILFHIVIFVIVTNTNLMRRSLEVEM